MFIPLIVNTAAIFAFGKEDLRLISHENEKNSRFYEKVRYRYREGQIWVKRK